MADANVLERTLLLINESLIDLVECSALLLPLYDSTKRSMLAVEVLNVVR